MPITIPIVFCILLILSLSLPFLVQIILHSRACGGGTGCSGLIHKAGEDHGGGVDGNEIFRI